MWNPARRDRFAEARPALYMNRFLKYWRITGYLLFPNWAALIRTLVDGEPPPAVLQA